MSSKFELSIDVNYVKSWGIVEAAREFFQNSYDEEVSNPNNKHYFKYDKDSETLTIGNELSILKSETLLLGCTSKGDSNDTIGQFGEGYKIATVVALRTGHGVTFYNYGAREVWTTKLVKSRKYGGRLVPTFIIDKVFDWKSFFSTKEQKNLYIEITNVTEEEYKDIVNSNLNLIDDNIESCKTEYGSIILNKEYKGNIYVSGLFVYNDPTMKYGYNINPEYLKLDRDRMTVSSFDLQWITSRMWMNYSINNSSDLLSLLLKESLEYQDVRYISGGTGYVINDIYKKFIEEYGNDAVPVTSEEMRSKLEKCGNRTVFVSEAYYGMLSKYSGPDSVVVKEKTLYSRYLSLLRSLEEFMTDEQREEEEELLNESKYILGGE